MKKIIADGWHTVEGYEVYVENGKILRGILGKGNAQRTAYPYKVSKYGGMDIDTGISVDAFRAGVKRGTKELR